ncbi:hypothetical protein SAMN05443144_10197 [Fodinibius roseus]|uniref:Uncharacterized protein n=1 Tax=Fodinibius roseus TaxID=1194090 RepID=A0A1M4SQK3_9BACT|nr:hypothetical protein [Fodinibius roseus]SHE34478.1 hypothetical protein SAMN05443144_10197 [Fodinibius roseus]
MKKLTVKFVNYLLVAIVITVSISCKDSVTGDPDLSESLEPVEDVHMVPGAENTTLTVNLNKEDAYFNVQFENIEQNDVIANGIRDAWCIDVWKPIDHNGGTYTDIELYSTDRVEKWLPLNYLLNIQEELINEDTEISWREIQLAIWSLRANPEFNLDEVDLVELPGEFKKSGEPNFSQEKVEEILNIVQEGYEDFDFSTGSKFAVIAAMPSDLQTFITIVEKK